MNDRYLYRAKHIHALPANKHLDGTWIEGYLCNENYINSPSLEGEFLIDSSTICQCTAMPDKNRKIAYEHDIIKTPVGNAKIIWSCSSSPTNHLINVGFKVVFLDATANDNYRNDLGYWIGKSEVIGNIFDNPELLE